MINAKQEFISEVEGHRVRCAVVPLCTFCKVEGFTKAMLREGYTQAEYDQFLSLLDFEYDNGYGGQLLDGTIWFAGGSWATRGEYDGSEWWEDHKRPTVPAELKAAK